MNGATELNYTFDNILNEISGNSVFFCKTEDEYTSQSHLFSCLSLLELLDDGSAIMDKNSIHWTDASEELHTIDISCEFINLNTHFGFYKHVFTEFSENYKILWVELFKKVSECSIDISNQIELFEENCYSLFIERNRKDCAFVEIIKTGDVTTLPTPAPDPEQVPSVKPVIHSYSKKSGNKTLRRRRVLTPIFRRRGFNRTYKNVGSD